MKTSKNPLASGPAPTLVSGERDVYDYRGRWITVRDGHAVWRETTNARIHDFVAVDDQAALQNAQFIIDVIEAGDPWRSSVGFLEDVIDRIVTAKPDVPITRAAVAREVKLLNDMMLHHGEHMVEIIGYRPDQIRGFHSLSVPDQVEFIDKSIDYGRRRGAIPPDRLDNPLLSGTPPQYITGGLGLPQIWAYKGRQIKVQRIQPAWATATWLEPLESGGDTVEVGAPDEVSALANARFRIDVYELGWRGAEELVGHALDDFSDHERGYITRANVARHIEMIQKEIRRTGSPPRDVRVTASDVDAFNRLSVAERVKLIDEVIEFYKRADALPSKRVLNPAKKKSGRTPWEVMGYDGDWQSETILPSHTDHRIHVKRPRKDDAMKALREWAAKHPPLAHGRRAPWLTLTKAGRPYAGASYVAAWDPEPHWVDERTKEPLLPASKRRSSNPSDSLAPLLSWSGA